MRVKTLGLITTALLVGIGLGLFISKSSQKAQPTVAFSTVPEKQPDLTLFMKTCPGVPVGSKTGMTDYEVGLTDGFVAVKRRHDEVWVLIHTDAKMKQDDLMRMSCEAVRKDFLSWGDSRQYLLRKSEQETEDSPVRYSLKDYRHGNIVGLALVDQKIGRVWLLASVKDSKGKKDRDEFQELGVNGLWEDPSANFSWQFDKDEGVRRMYLSVEYQDRETKEFTLPLLVRQGRAQARSTDPWATKIKQDKK